MSAQHVKPSRKKCGKLCKTAYFLYSKFKKTHSSFTILKLCDHAWTWFVVHKNKVMCKISAQYIGTCRRNLLRISHIHSSKRSKNLSLIDAKWRHSTWSEVYQNKVICNISAQYVKICRKKCEKLHISYIISFKRGKSPSTIDAKWRHSTSICSTLIESLTRTQNFGSNVKVCRRKVR